MIKSDKKKMLKKMLKKLFFIKKTLNFLVFLYFICYKEAQNFS